MQPGTNPIQFTVWGQLFADQPTKSQRTQVRIADAAIQLYAKEGAQATTFEKIAKTAKVSRAITLRYFPDYRTLNAFVSKYIRAQFQELAVQRTMAAQGHKAQLAAYVDSTFEWVGEYSHHAKVWLYFYYLCALDKKLSTVNRDLVDIGHRRIQALIEEGQKAGAFPKSDAQAAAKAVQVQITGALVSFMSEGRDKDIAKIRKATLLACQHCLGIGTH